MLEAATPARDSGQATRAHDPKPCAWERVPQCSEAEVAIDPRAATTAAGEPELRGHVGREREHECEAASGYYLSRFRFEPGSKT